MFASGSYNPILRFVQQILAPVCIGDFLKVQQYVRDRICALFHAHATARGFPPVSSKLSSKFDAYLVLPSSAMLSYLLPRLHLFFLCASLNFARLEEARLTNDIQAGRPPLPSPDSPSCVGSQRAPARSRARTSFAVEASVNALTQRGVRDFLQGRRPPSSL